MKNYSDDIFNKSSFLSVQNDLNRIVNKMLKNEKLKKLLFYEIPDCLKQPYLTQEQTLGLVNKNIRIVPKVPVDKEALNYIIITMDNFITNDTNPQFRDCFIDFDVMCHIDQWNLGNYQLRPFLIMGEIDGMFNNSKLTGIGTLQFEYCKQMIINNKISGYTMRFAAIHGSDDRIDKNV